MTDLYWPEDIVPAETELRLHDAVGRHEAPLTSFVQAVGRPGSRLEMAMRFQILSGRARAQLKAIYAATRGGARAIWCRDHSYRESDYHSVLDLVTNPTFANGTTGYTFGSGFSGAVIDRVLRATRLQNTGGNTAIVRLSSAATVTPFQPYLLRVLVVPGAGPTSGLSGMFGSTAFGAEYKSTVFGADAGLLQLVFVPHDASTHVGIVQNAQATARDYLDINYFSFAPCALVDNAPNYIPFSVDLANAAWNQGARMSVTSTSVVLPDGSAGTSNVLREDGTSANTHFLGDNITVTTMLGDWCIAGAFKAANRTWVQIRLQDVTAAATAVANLNLSTGALGTVSGGSPTWENPRAFVVSLGNGWYYLALVARNTTSNTNIGARIFIGEGDGDATFDGLNQDSIYAWRPTLAQSGVPIRLSATTGTAAQTGTKQPLGGGIYIRGLTAYASTAEFIKRGGYVQIGNQLQILEAPLDVDASGRAFLPIPSLRSKPVDGTPVLFVNPMLRLMPMEPVNGWTNRAGNGNFSDSDLLLGEVG